jgi:hypothetical protein
MYFGSWFQRVQYMVACSMHLRRISWWQRRALHLMMDKKQGKGMHKGARNKILPRTH